MHLLALSAIALLGAGGVWVDGPHTRYFADSTPPAVQTLEHRLYMAKGERESFQIVIQSKRKQPEIVQIEVKSHRHAMGPPEVRMVGYVRTGDPSPRAVGRSPLWPDPLLSTEPFIIPAGQTRSLWVTYETPPGIEAGLYDSSIDVVIGKRRRRTVSVTIEVFDFTLPQVPSLRTLFSLDRKALQAGYAIFERDREDWMPMYDALSGYRLSYSVWDGRPLAVKTGHVLDMEALKEHVGHAVEAGGMNTIDIGPPGGIAALFPKPSTAEQQDPLQLYLFDVNNWLHGRGWIDRAVIEVAPWPERDDWQATREAYFRVGRADSRVQRLLAGPYHPFFERYTDIWAVPLSLYHPGAHRLLREGRSLAAPVEHPAAAVTAARSTAGPGLPRTLSIPEDAYDGSLISAWSTEFESSPRHSPWIQIDFESPVTASGLRIAWRPGHRAQQTRIRTAYDGKQFSTATASWQEAPPADDYDFHWSTATFSIEKTFLSLRLEFSGGGSRRVLSIAEIAFGRTPIYEPLPRSQAVEPWLLAVPRRFPSFSVDAHPLEYRLLPWVCWGHDLDGFKGGYLNQWPEAWRGLAKSPPRLWPAARRNEQCLVYPGPNGPIPSIRLELLREGMEDYEYLHALDSHLRTSKTKDPELTALIARRLYPPAPLPSDLNTLQHFITDTRIAIGRALTQRAAR